MNRFEQNLKEVTDWSVKKMKCLKIKLWEDKTNKLTVFFIIAALLVVSFTYHQYARRNYAISAGTQRRHNQSVKGKFDRMNNWNQQLQSLNTFTGNMPIDEEFERKVRQIGIENIQHKAQLLSNCTQQYVFDENQVRQCEKTFDDLLNKIDHGKKAPS